MTDAKKELTLSEIEIMKGRIEILQDQEIVEGYRAEDCMNEAIDYLEQAKEDIKQA